MNALGGADNKSTITHGSIPGVGCDVAPSAHREVPPNGLFYCLRNICQVTEDVKFREYLKHAPPLPPLLDKHRVMN